MLIDDAKHHTLFTTNVHCVAIRKYACLVLFIHHSRLFYLNPLRLFGCNSGYWSPSVFVLVPAGVLRCTFIATAANGMEKKGALNCDFLLHTWSLIEAPGMVWVEGVQCTMASQWWRLSVWLWHEDVNNASSERLDKTTPATATGTWRWTLCADIAVELFAFPRARARLRYGRDAAQPSSMPQGQINKRAAKYYKRRRYKNEGNYMAWETL